MQSKNYFTTAALINFPGTAAAAAAKLKEQKTHSTGQHVNSNFMAPV
jgi:hypothetical protein